MSILSIIKGKNQDKIIDTGLGLVKDVRSMIDESKLTPEEALKYNVSLADKTVDFVATTYNENSERSKTRRSIAVFFIRYFCFLVLAIIVLWRFDKDWAEFVLKLMVDLYLAAAFITIIIFFFGGYYMDKYKGHSKKNK